MRRAIMERISRHQVTPVRWQIGWIDTALSLRTPFVIAYSGVGHGVPHPTSPTATGQPARFRQVWLWRGQAPQLAACWRLLVMAQKGAPVLVTKQRHSGPLAWHCGGVPVIGQ